MRQILLTALLLLPVPVAAENSPEAPVPAETLAPAAEDTTEAPASPAPQVLPPEEVEHDAAAKAAASPAPQVPPSVTPQAPAPETPPRPLGQWSLRGFLNGTPAILSQSPHEGTWRIRTNAVEIVLRPATREATVAGKPIPWPAIPLAPDSSTALQSGPEMPERSCRFWIQETPAVTHAWCLDAQGRPQRILTRQGDQWRIVFDAETRETAALWRILHAIGG